MYTRPAIIWALDFADGRVRDCARDDRIACAPGADHFRWLHLNLADQWTLRWIEASSELPPPLRELLLSTERHQRALVEGGYVGCVLHDVERDFDKHDAERTGALRLALGPRLMITARHHPLRSADIVRSRIDRRETVVRDAVSALSLVVSAIVDNVAATARDYGERIEGFEDMLLDHPEGFDHRRLIGIRRRVVQFHRLLSGMHAVLRRLETDEELPEPLLPTVERLAQQLGEIDGDMLAVQGQLRLLREEADLQATQRTNQNLYALSILSALLLPATLVTGFFGMNTGGLPFAAGAKGTLLAGLAAGGASLGVYLLMRWLGFVRRG